MKKMSLVILSVLVTSNLVFAHDYWVPDWRGEPGTTWSVWDDWAQYPGPMPPDAFTANPAGVASPYATADPDSAFLLDSWTDGLGENRWNVLHIVGDDELGFHLDNYDRNFPEKLVRIQISHDSDHARPLAFNVLLGYDGVTFPIHVPADLVAVTEPPGWVTAAYEFSVEPNPQWEEIYLKFDWDPAHDPSAYVDQVVIDTWCIPEPSTLVLLSAGAVGLLACAWRRRRRR